MHGGKDEKTALFLLFDDTQLITSKVRQPSLKFSISDNGQHLFQLVC